MSTARPPRALTYCAKHWRKPHGIIWDVRHTLPVGGWSVTSNASNLPVTHLADYLYFSVVVMTTLGFGDIYPATTAARIIVAMQCLTSYVMFALMIGIITRGILPAGSTKQ